MRAALLAAGQSPLEIVEDVEIAEPRANEVLIKVANCGICHSERFISHRMPLADVNDGIAKLHATDGIRTVLDIAGQPEIPRTNIQQAQDLIGYAVSARRASR